MLETAKAFSLEFFHQSNEEKLGPIRQNQIRPLCDEWWEYRMPDKFQGENKQEVVLFMKENRVLKSLGFLPRSPIVIHREFSNGRH